MIKPLIFLDHLALNNLLFDKESLQLTAILDYDWALIGTPSDEFCMSFGDFIKLSGDSNDHVDLYNALLSGSSVNDVNQTTADNVDWEVARTWDQCLDSAGVQRYSTIPGFSQISRLRDFAKAIAPWGVVNEVAIEMKKRQGGGDLEKIMEEAQSHVDMYLREHGF